VKYLSDFARFHSYFFSETLRSASVPSGCGIPKTYCKLTIFE
jgi:hypothetical protein